MRSFSLNRTKTISLLAGVSFAALFGASSADATSLYLTYSDSIQNQSGYTSDNTPTIDNDGLSQGTHSSPDHFNVGTSLTAPQLFFEVDPNSCLRSGSFGSCAQTSGNLDDTVTVTFSFYSGPNGTLLGTLTDTAQADFSYTGYGNGTDNICWQNNVTSAGSGITLGPTKQTGTCSSTKSLNSGTGNEEINFLLGAQNFEIQLNDWTDWDEQPSIQFGDARISVPEPFTLSLFGAGLAGAAAMRRRKKR